MNIIFEDYKVTGDGIHGYNVEGPKKASYFFVRNRHSKLLYPVVIGKGYEPRIKGYRIFTDENGVIEPVR